MKSVVAFANSYGGKIIFGVEDKTREIVGVEEEKAFQIMDSIANAISDSCEPAIIPDITLQTVKNKKLIVVGIAASTQRPYYIKALGRENGVYIRVSGTTRRADETRLKELMFEGANKAHGERSLVFKVNNYKIYVKTWSEIFAEFKIRYEFLLDKLSLSRDKLMQTYKNADDVIDQQKENSAKMAEEIKLKK